MKKPLVLLTTAASALALAGVVGVGVATAGPTSSPPSAGSTPSMSPTPTAGSSSTASAPRQGPGKPRRDLTRRALHGEVTLAGKKHRVVDFQRGTVSAVSKDSVTVRSVDGFAGTYLIDSKTRVRIAKKQAAIGDITTGDHVRVVAVKDGQALTASRIVDRDH